MELADGAFHHAGHRLMTLVNWKCQSRMARTPGKAISAGREFGERQ
jgi:hypothetical protein